MLLWRALGQVVPYKQGCNEHWCLCTLMSLVLLFFFFFWLNTSSLEVFPLNSGVGTGLGEATRMPWIFMMPVLLFPQPAMWKPQWGSSLML